MNGDDLNNFDSPLGFDTLAIRAGYNRTQEAEHSEAIFPTSSYVYQSAAQAAARFSGDEPGNIYSRFTNPTVRGFEQRLAALEGAQSCVATSSGMAAIMSTCLGLLKSGDHIVSSRAIFGSTVVLFNNYMARFNVETTYVDLTDIQAWEAAIQANTKILFLETPSNPLVEIADVTQLAALAHQHDCLLVVDNCLCTPALQKPLELGADIVIHSATKYLDGQGRGVGGAVLGAEDVIAEVYSVLRTTGPTMSPFNAWIFLKGLETLSLRMNAHCNNALQLALWLAQHPAVDKVHYPGLPEHPGHHLAKQQQQNFGGLLSFELKQSSRQYAWQVVDSTRLLSITANLGDVKTTITHPATTTHARVPDEERQKAGITDGLLRLAVGLESIDDIKNDLDRGLSLLL